MANADMLRPYIEQQLATLLEVDHVQKDEDGDIPVRRGTSMTFVRTCDGPVGPIVRFFAPLLIDVRKSPELLERLNQLNMDSPFVRYFWTDDQVICAMDIAAEHAQGEEIANALGAVGWHADHLDEGLKADFGGEVFITEASDEAVEPTAGEGGAGGYL